MREASVKIDITALLDGKERNTLSATVETTGDNGMLAMSIGTSDATIPFTIDLLEALLQSLKERAKEKGIKLSNKPPVFVGSEEGFQSMRNRVLEAMAKGNFTKELADEALADLEKRIKRLVEDPNTFNLKELLKTSRSKAQFADQLKSLMRDAREASPEDAPPDIRARVGDVPPEVRARIKEALKGAFSDMPDGMRVEVVDASEDPELAEALVNGDLSPEEALFKSLDIARSVDFEGFSIHQHNDGKVCMGYEGSQCENTLAELQALAFRFDIPFLDSKQLPIPEKELAATVIDFLKDINHDGQPIH